MLCHRDPSFIYSVTFFTGARGLLVGTLEAICFPGKTCLVPSVSSHRSGAPVPSRSWNPLLKFASVCWCVSCIWEWSLWYSGCGLMRTVQGNPPFSLLAVVLLTQPRKLLAFAASALCWLMLSSISTKTFHWPASQQSPACIVYSFPSAFVLVEFQEVPISVWRQVPDLPSAFLGACLSPFKGAPCKWAALDAACQVPWTPMGWVLLRYLSQSSSTAEHHFLQLRLSVLRPGRPFWRRLDERSHGVPQPYLWAWSLSHVPLLLCSLKNRSLFLKIQIKSIGTVLWTKVKVFLAWYLVSVVRYSALFQRI